MLSRAISPSFGMYSAVLRHSGLLISRVVSVDSMANPIQNLVVSVSFHHGSVVEAQTRRRQRVVGELNSWARLLIMRSVPLNASFDCGTTAAPRGYDHQLSALPFLNPEVRRP